MIGRPDVRDRIGPLLVGCYVLLMPLLAGMPRGSLAPLVRPTEILQIAITAVGLALAIAAASAGNRWFLQLRPLEWWLGAAVVASSVVPLLWLMARGRPITLQDLTSSLPLLKYAALYLLVRVTVRTERDAGLIIRFAVAGALVVSLVTFAQAAGVGFVTDALGRWFVSSPSDLVDIGRATTTIGSSIATGSYLAVSCGLALSRALGARSGSWLLITAALGSATVATGQIGAVLALAILVVLIARFHSRSPQVIALAFPFIAATLFLVWPVVDARLADLDPTTGLPTSWLIRWTNVTELYWPSLADGGWILGVGPNAVIVPPDIWRDQVFLESGYLWLLWVGGLPLLIAAAGFLLAAFRDLDYSTVTSGSPIHATRLAARASVAMIAVMSVLDPHLTLRAEADLLFTMLAVGMAGVPFVVTDPTPHRRWQHRLNWWRAPAGDPPTAHARARLQVAEAPTLGADGLDPRLAAAIESHLALRVRADDEDLGRATLALCRDGSRLHGVVTGPLRAVDREAAALVWRAIALCASSLRLASLQSTRSAVADRDELVWAGRLAEAAELSRSDSATATEMEDAGGRRSTRSLQPPVRLVVGNRLPWWKRAFDVAAGTACLVLSVPLWAMCAASIRLSSPGPILFRQVRIGAGGLPFQVYKFRTMYVDNDDSAHRESNRRELLEGAEAAKLGDDRRVTPVGRWLRRLSLDELPQLLNVLRSEMSLVGPRPSLLWEVEMFDPPKRRRLSVHPGMTGLWQVSGRADVSMTTMLDMDLAYVDTMSPSVDLRCLVGTATTVLSGKGAR